MANKYFVNASDLKTVADEIRTKNGTTNQLLFPDEFVSAIRSIEGGGENALNFHVVGSVTQPTEPSENTIWVKTSQAVTAWTFSAATPAEPIEGAVWIKTSDSGKNGFNALNENAVIVRPQIVRQYTAGAWISKDAMLYRNEEWIEVWCGYLFRSGDQYSFVTGGFELAGWVYIANTSTSLGAIQFTNTQILMTQSGMTKNTGCALTTINKINLSGYDSITFEGEFYATGEYVADYCRAFVSRDRTTTVRNAPAYVALPSAGVTHRKLTFDVSALSGEYYVALSMYINQGYTISYKIDKIYLTSNEVVV